MANYNVLFTPEIKDGYPTVRDLKVIDAWSSDGNLVSALDHMETQLDRYRQEHGDGSVEVVETHTKRRRIL